MQIIRDTEKWKRVFWLKKAIFHIKMSIEKSISDLKIAGQV